MEHRESDTQQACYKWFCLQYPEYRKLFFSVPNGAKVSQSQARILRREGLTAGVADTMLLVARQGYHGLAVEFKTTKGVQSQEQKDFERAVTKQGYRYSIVRSFEDFHNLINSYIGENDSPIQEMLKILNKNQ